MAQILVAPDKFKGSLPAQQVADSVIGGLRAAVAGIDAIAVPVADGGEGTLAAALAAGFTPVPVTAGGPTGTPVRTAYARRDALAVVEMADISGLVCLPEGRSEPLTAGSRGTGEVIAAAPGWSDVVAVTTGEDLREHPGAGAAGGVGFAAVAMLGATLHPGIELVLDLAGFHDRLDGAELVVVVCGRTTLGSKALEDARIEAVHALSELEPDLHKSIAGAAPLLELLAAELLAAELIERDLPAS